MSRVKVKVDKHQLAYFRKLARESPLEVHAYLVGEVVSPTYVRIDKFIYPKDGYFIQTTGSVQWRPDELFKLRQSLLKDGYLIVGDIHSHPQWDAVMSPADYSGAITDGLRICGICSVYNKKTRVRFWVPDSALSCEISHT